MTHHFGNLDPYTPVYLSQERIILPRRRSLYGPYLWTGVTCLKAAEPIVGKGGGGHTPPPLFSDSPPLLDTQGVRTFHRFVGKIKVLNNSCNDFVYNYYPQSILFWKNVYKSGEIKTCHNAFMKIGCQLEKGVWNYNLKSSSTWL